MPEVDGNTLVMAVQAIDEKLRTLEAARDRAGDDADDYFEEILAYDQAAHKLRIAYEEACESASNLPPYERLVKRPGGK